MDGANALGSNKFNFDDIMVYYILIYDFLPSKYLFVPFETAKYISTFIIII